MNLDKLELLATGQVQLRFEKVLFDAEGNEVLVGYHREVRTPNDDISDLPADTQASIKAHWTAERVVDWESSQADPEL